VNASVVVGILVGCVSLLVSFATGIAVIVTMKSNLQQVGKNQDSQSEAEKKTAREVVELLVTLKEFMAAQAVINKQVSSLLDNVVQEMAEVSKRTVEASTVVSLLTEFLKKGNKGLNLE
jgi:tRNA C32,U32 (ribose-2'-O)-methylase TrmJ